MSGPVSVAPYTCLSSQPNSSSTVRIVASGGAAPTCIAPYAASRW